MLTCIWGQIFSRILRKFVNWDNILVLGSHSHFAFPQNLRLLFRSFTLTSGVLLHMVSYQVNLFVETRSLCILLLITLKCYETWYNHCSAMVTIMRSSSKAVLGVYLSIYGITLVTALLKRDWSTFPLINY